jgi:TatD DNase family protein
MTTHRKYTDAHLHLQDDRLWPVAGELIGRAHAAHVTRLLCNGITPADWPRVLDLAARHDCVVPFIGLHPWHIEQAPDAWQADLESIIRTHRAGVGEIGLDFAKPFDRERQRLAFEFQLALAVRHRRPVSIHAVKAWATLTECLRNASPLPAPFMIHAFNGSPEMARELIALGGYVSFNALSFAGARRDKTRTLLHALPQDRILFETESPAGLNPYVEFIPCREDRPNEPANLPAIVAAAAELVGQNSETFADRIEENAMRFIRPLKDMHT